MPEERKYEFLDPDFLEAMNEIGRYGYEKYGKNSFQYRRESDYQVWIRHGSSTNSNSIPG